MLLEACYGVVGVMSKKPVKNSNAGVVRVKNQRKINIFRIGDGRTRAWKGVRIDEVVCVWNTSGRNRVELDGTNVIRRVHGKSGRGELAGVEPDHAVGESVDGAAGVVQEPA
jgi:hypothetical protein